MSTTAVQPAEVTTAEAPVTVEEVKVVPAENEAPVEAAAAADPAVPAVGESEKPVEGVEKPEEAAGEKKEEKPVPHAIEHGILSKNSHGALLSFFKQKRFFYFQDDSISEENLRLYLYKDSANKVNAAYAMQTGKGLWFYTKDESRKDLPHGIIKLADVTEVVLHGNKQFVLKLPTGDLHFESSPAERDNWVFTLKSKIEEAKASHESITESESYKTTLDRLSKSPAAVAPPKTAEKEEAEKSEVSKTDEAAADNNETGAEAAITSEGEEVVPAEAKDVKRSTSRKGKRTSKFSDFFGGKKEKEKEKEKSEEKDDDAKKDEPVPGNAEVTTSAPADAVATESTEETKTEEDVKPTDEAVAATTESKPKPPPSGKRHSFFRSLIEKKGEATVEKKDKEGVDSTKELPPLVTSEGETNPAESTAMAAEEKPAEKVTTPSSPPKQKFLALLGKRDKSPSPKATEEKVEAPVETKPDIAAEPTTEPATSGEVAVETPKEGDTPTEATSPATREKRISSFFSFKKEKKSDEVKSDSEDTGAASTTETPPKSSSPVPKGLSLTSLKRKVSRAGKGKEQEVKDVVTPPAVVEEVEKTEAPPTVTQTAEPIKSDTQPETPAAPVIGDVVPDAVTVGQTRPVQAAA